MNQYTVRSGQNLYDVAITLHGTIEGIFDLLLSNEGISLETELHCGDILNYNEEFIINSDITTSIQSRGIVVRNGSHEFDCTGPEETIKRHISDNHKDKMEELEAMSPDERNMYWKGLVTPRMIIRQDGKVSAFSAQLHKGTHIFVDWGDYTVLETIEPTEGEELFEHCYKGGGGHTILFYGDFSFKTLDMTGINGIYYPLDRIMAETFKTAINNETINKLITK